MVLQFPFLLPTWSFCFCFLELFPAFPQTIHKNPERTGVKLMLSPVGYVLAGKERQGRDLSAEEIERFSTLCGFITF